MNNAEGISQLWKKEDWWAVWIGFAAILLAVAGAVSSVPKFGTWSSNPLDLFSIVKDGEILGSHLPGVLGVYLGLGVAFALAVRVMGEKTAPFLVGFTTVILLAIVAYVFAHQSGIKGSGLGYAFWALVIGLLISNTLGTPEWLKSGAKTELYIKTGLVLLGAEILFGKILQKGGPALFVAWGVTPIVVVFMYLFGTRVLKMPGKALVIVIATATSVCGVSAAIAAAAASRAKKEELTLAVGMTLIFTVGMMVAMPVVINSFGMDLEVGAAWMGGTIDATGAVVAAGAFLGDEPEKIAAIVKMVQNILIGVVAFCIAVFWVTNVERDENSVRPSLSEVWVRFPKFILGFVAASLLFSFVIVPTLGKEAIGMVAADLGDAVTKKDIFRLGAEMAENDIIKPMTKNLRGWLFCMAFVSIGLESNFRELAKQLVGGKPIVLYLVGQSFNLILTLLAAYLAFGGLLFEKAGG